MFSLRDLRPRGVIFINRFIIWVYCRFFHTVTEIKDYTKKLY